MSIDISTTDLEVQNVIINVTSSNTFQDRVLMGVILIALEHSYT